MFEDPMTNVHDVYAIMFFMYSGRLYRLSPFFFFFSYMWLSLRKNPKCPVVTCWKPSSYMLHPPWLLLGTSKKDLYTSFSYTLEPYTLPVFSALLSKVDVLTIQHLSNCLPLHFTKIDGILRFSCQLQMQPFTKLHAHFPSHPLNKRPHSLPYSSKQSLLLYFLGATSFPFINTKRA